MSSKICSVAACDRVVESKGYCKSHANWSRENGGAVPAHAIGRIPLKPKLPCSVEVCDRMAESKGYCLQHAAWSRNNGGAVPEYAIRSILRPGEKRDCSVEVCDRMAESPLRNWSWCKAHADWSRNHPGEVPIHAIRLTGRPQGKVWSLEEILAHASPYDRGQMWVYAKLLPVGFFDEPKWADEAFLEDCKPCLAWPVTPGRRGYAGNIETSRGRHSAYRAVAELAHRGPIPEWADEVDHICELRSCVEPSHLELVPSSENRRRAALSRERRGVLSQHPEAVRRREDRERQALLPG